MTRLQGVALAILVLLSGSTLHADLVATINPIIVCDDAGNNCANESNELFELAGDKIWSQAGIDLNFLPFSFFFESDYLNIEDDGELTFENLTDIAGHGQSADLTVINLWFVNDVEGAYGIGWLGGSGIAISDSIFSGLGRIDTIAHEIGHNLGLPHNDGSPSYLMASGGVRIPAQDLANIWPDGADRDFLNTGEISLARASFLLDEVPEPATMGSVVLALALLAGWRSRRPGRHPAQRMSQHS
jgi:hypothetical protein